MWSKCAQERIKGGIQVKDLQIKSDTKARTRHSCYKEASEIAGAKSEGLEEKEEKGGKRKLTPPKLYSPST